MLRRLLSLAALALTACATAPAPPSRSLHDPSNPQAEETPAAGIAVARPSSPASAAAVDAGASVYACPMHPDVTASEPGHRCPKCGMELVLRRPAP